MSSICFRHRMVIVDVIELGQTLLGPSTIEQDSSHLDEKSPVICSDSRNDAHTHIQHSISRTPTHSHHTALMHLICGLFENR